MIVELGLLDAVLRVEVLLVEIHLPGRDSSLLFAYLGKFLPCKPSKVLDRWRKVLLLFLYNISYRAYLDLRLHLEVLASIRYYRCLDIIRVSDNRVVGINWLSATVIFLIEE